MGRLNYHGYLIPRFYPTREIYENFMHAKITWFTVGVSIQPDFVKFSTFGGHPFYVKNQNGNTAYFFTDDKDCKLTANIQITDISDACGIDRDTWFHHLDLQSLES